MFIIISANSNFGSVANLALKYSKIVTRTIFDSISIHTFSIAVTPATFGISNLVPFVYKKCATLADNCTHYIIK